MEFVEALDAALGERYALGPTSRNREPKTPITQHVGLRARMQRIVDKFGGRHNRHARVQAARAVGIPYSTFGHMLRGRQPKEANVRKVEEAFRRLVTAPAYAALVKKRGYPSSVSIKAVVVADPDVKDASGKVKREGAKYVNIKQAGPGNEMGYREFNAENLTAQQMAAVVDAWVWQGAAAAAATLTDALPSVYDGTPFGFEGDHVKVEFHG